MKQRHYGAIVHGRRSGADVCSSVEARTLFALGAAERVVMLAAVQGDLATPALESIKSAFARLTEASAASASALVASAPPPPYAAGVAVVLLFGDRAFVATSGGACSFSERAGVLAALPPGEHDVRAGDGILAASHAHLVLGSAFFTAPFASAVATASAEFHNGSLDDALEAALTHRSAAFIAVAAVRVEA